MATRWQRLRSRLIRPFRVTVKREETFEVAGAFTINLANLLGLAFGLAITLGLMMFAVVALTPLKTYLPGYSAQADDRAEVVNLNRRLREIEIDLAANATFTSNIQRVLVGDVTRYDKAAEAYLPSAADSAKAVARIPEDEDLRDQVATGRTRSNQATVETGIPIDQVHLASPVDGTVSGPFDPVARHFGVDVVAPASAPVMSMLDGYVVEAGYSLETGNVIAVQHPGNLLSFYKHNAALLKRTGDFVRAGEAIAIIGNTGTHTDGPHVHVELWHRGQPIDPARYVRFD